MKNLFYITLIIFSNCQAQVSFFEHPIVSNYNNTMSVREADIDNDGDKDIIACALGDNRISWYENKGRYIFEEHLVTTNCQAVRTVCGGDVDGDGKTDIVSASYNEDKISLWRNNNGSFMEVVIADTFNAAHTVVLTDLNKDGKPDIICAGMEGSGVGIWMNNGGLKFTSKYLAKREGPTYADSCDFNNDGYTDIITATYYQGGGISIWKNNGNCEYTEMYLPLPFAHWAATGDIDNDGDKDIAAVSCGNNIRWYEATSETTFTIHVLSANYNCGTSIYLADINNDGLKDLISTAENLSELTVWQNKGDKTFERFSISSIQGASDAWILDIDKDYDKDILCAYRFDNSIKLWENRFYRTEFSISKSTGHAPLKVDFKDSSNHVLPIIKYSWDFDGDGLYDAVGKNVNWTFNYPGEYNVTIKADTDSLIYIYIYSRKMCFSF